MFDLWGNEISTIAQLDDQIKSVTRHKEHDIISFLPDSNIPFDRSKLSALNEPLFDMISYSDFCDLYELLFSITKRNVYVNAKHLLIFFHKKAEIPLLCKECTLFCRDCTESCMKHTYDCRDIILGDKKRKSECKDIKSDSKDRKLHCMDCNLALRDCNSGCGPCRSGCDNCTSVCKNCTLDCSSCTSSCKNCTLGCSNCPSGGCNCIFSYVFNTILTSSKKGTDALFLYNETIQTNRDTTIEIIPKAEINYANSVDEDTDNLMTEHIKENQARFDIIPQKTSCGYSYYIPFVHIPEFLCMYHYKDLSMKKKKDKEKEKKKQEALTDIFNVAIYLLDKSRKNPAISAEALLFFIKIDKCFRLSQFTSLCQEKVFFHDQVRLSKLRIHFQAEDNIITTDRIFDLKLVEKRLISRYPNYMDIFYPFLTLLADFDTSFYLGQPFSTYQDYIESLMQSQPLHSIPIHNSYSQMNGGKPKAPRKQDDKQTAPDCKYYSENCPDLERVFSCNLYNTEKSGIDYINIQKNLDKQEVNLYDTITRIKFEILSNNFFNNNVINYYLYYKKNQKDIAKLWKHTDILNCLCSNLPCS